jgi:hypothetical protein
VKFFQEDETKPAHIRNGENDERDQKTIHDWIGVFTRLSVLTQETDVHKD